MTRHSTIGVAAIRGWALHGAKRSATSGRELDSRSGSAAVRLLLSRRRRQRWNGHASCSRQATADGAVLPLRWPTQVAGWGYDVYGLDTKALSRELHRQDDVKGNRCHDGHPDTGGSCSREAPGGCSSAGPKEPGSWRWQRQPPSKEAYAGLITMGLGDRNVLGWRFADNLTYLTRKQPNEPTFSALSYMPRIAPLPLVMLQSTKDEYVGRDEANRLFNAAAEPKRFVPVEAQNHRFDGAQPEFFRQLRQALEWASRRGRNSSTMNSVAETSSGGGKAWIGYSCGGRVPGVGVPRCTLERSVCHVKAMTWWLLVPAIAADIGSYVTQGARWSLLLRPLGRLSLLKATQAIYAALFTNEVLPLRVGEVLRGYLASRWMSLPLTPIFSSILVERFLDGVWMVLAFGVVVLAVPLPQYLVDAEGSLALVIFAAAALFIYLVVRKERQIEAEGARSEPAPPDSAARRLSRSIEHVAAALRLIGGAPSLYGAAALSGLLLVLQVLSFWLVMEAYGISLSVWHGAAVFLIVHLGTMIPGAPSNVGTYQFFTVLGLMLFGVDKTVASGFSVVVFLILTIPLWVVGLFAFGRAGLDLRTVREQAANLGRLWRIPPVATCARPDGGTGGDNDSVGD